MLRIHGEYMKLLAVCSDVGLENGYAYMGSRMGLIENLYLRRESLILHKHPLLMYVTSLVEQAKDLVGT